MRPVRDVIEEALDCGADTKEVLEGLRNEGWHFTHGPVYSRWAERDDEVFGVIGAVDHHPIVVKTRVSKRSLAHMNAEGIQSIRRAQTIDYADRLLKLLSETTP